MAINSSLNHMIDQKYQRKLTLIVTVCKEFIIPIPANPDKALKRFSFYYEIQLTQPKMYKINKYIYDIYQRVHINTYIYMSISIQHLYLSICIFILFKSF